MLHGLKIGAFAAILAFGAPFAAAAQEEGCSHEQAASCAEGFVWDAETRTCVQQVIG